MNADNEKVSVTGENHFNESVVPSRDSHLPEGDLTAWLTVFGAQVFLIHVGGLGFSSTFGIFEDFYTRHYLTDFSPSMISWIGSTNSFLIFSGGLLFGRLHDKGYFYWLMIGGCTLQSFCLFMLSLAQRNQYYQVFLCHGLGFGMAASMTHVPSLAVLSHHFKKRRTIAMSLANGGVAIGAIGYTILLNNLLAGGLGFANSIRIVAAINAVLLFIGCALMRTQPLHPKTQVRYSQLLRSCSADHPYTLASIGMLLFAAGSFFPLFYIQLDSNKHKLGEVFSFYTIVILTGATYIGSLTAGFIATGCGIPTTVIASTLSAGIIVFAMMGLSTRAGAVTLGVLYGYFFGVYGGLIAPIITHLTDDLSEIGARMGISHFMAGLGSLIGTPIAGALLGLNYRWWRPAVFCGCFSVAGTISFVIMQLILQHRRPAVPLAH